MAKQTTNQNTSDCSVFFPKAIFNYSDFGKLLLNTAGWLNTPIWLTVDRTNWKFGKIHINFLVIGVVFRKISIPIAWTLLIGNKCGNSNAKQRISLLKKALKIVPKDKVLGILADREFIGENWFYYLFSIQLPYIIRIKENRIIELEDGSTIQLKNLFRYLKKGRKSKIYHSVKLGKHTTNIRAKRLKDGKLLIVAFTGITDGCPINIYKKRWTIETLFSCMKKRGFNLEDTHMTDFKKLEKLFAIIALAVVWAVVIGKILQTGKTKKHGYLEKSDFHIGKHIIIQCFLEPDIPIKTNNYQILEGGVNVYVL